MLKKILAILTVLTLCIAMSTTALAQQQVTATPRLQYISTVSAKMTSSGNFSVTVTGKSSVSQIDITVTVQEKDGSSWSDVDWFGTDTTYDSSTLYSDSTSVMTKGLSYRIKAQIEVSTGSANEYTTKYSTAVVAR